MWWEEFLLEHKFRSLVELGAGNGGMSTFLAVQCTARGADFVTVDANFSRIDNPSVLRALGTVFLELDLNRPDSWPGFLARVMMLPRPLVLFCNDGDVREQVRQVASVVHAGDFLVVHGWNYEVYAQDIPPQFSLVWPEGDLMQSIRWFVSKDLGGPVTPLI